MHICVVLVLNGIFFWQLLSNLAQGQILVATDRVFCVYIVQEMLLVEAQKYQIFL